MYVVKRIIKETRFEREKNRGRNCRGTEKIAAGDDVPTGRIYILLLNPRVRASVTKRAKNDSHFYSRAEDEYKAGRIHFSYADTSERKNRNGPERF